MERQTGGRRPAVSRQDGVASLQNPKMSCENVRRVISELCSWYAKKDSPWVDTAGGLNDRYYILYNDARTDREMTGSSKKDGRATRL